VGIGDGVKTPGRRDRASRTATVELQLTTIWLMVAGVFVLLGVICLLAMQGFDRTETNQQQILRSSRVAQEDAANLRNELDSLRACITSAECRPPVTVVVSQEEADERVTTPTTRRTTTTTTTPAPTSSPTTTRPSTTTTVPCSVTVPVDGGCLVP
jgi:hypothetical protein